MRRALSVQPSTFGYEEVDGSGLDSADQLVIDPIVWAGIRSSQRRHEVGRLESQVPF